MLAADSAKAIAAAVGDPNQLTGVIDEDLIELS
jgi:hypothetical protein